MSWCSGTGCSATWFALQTTHSYEKRMVTLPHCFTYLVLKKLNQHWLVPCCQSTSSELYVWCSIELRLSSLHCNRWPFQQGLPSTPLLAWPVSLTYTGVLRLFQGGGSREGRQLRISQRKSTTILDHLIFFAFLRDGVQPSKVALLHLKLWNWAAVSSSAPLLQLLPLLAFLQDSLLLWVSVSGPGKARLATV